MKLVFFFIGALMIQYFEACIDLKKEMITIVSKLSKEAKKINKNFLVIPNLGTATALAAQCGEFTNAIDGVLRESLFYTENDVPVVWNSEHIRHLKNANQLCNKRVFIIDFCTKSTTKMDSYNQNKKRGFVSLQANYKAYFNEIPTEINDENPFNITHIEDVKNFLTFYGDNRDLLKNSSYDMVLIEPFFYRSSKLVDPAPLRVKKNKGQRLVLAYLSISELREDLHYFSDASPYQDECAPVDTEYGYLTQKFWMRGWHRILIKNMKAIVAKGYDGIFFDRIDSYCDTTKRKNAPNCLA